MSRSRGPCSPPKQFVARFNVPLEHTHLYSPVGVHDHLVLSWRGFLVTGTRLATLVGVFPPVLSWHSGDAALRHRKRSDTWCVRDERRCLFPLPCCSGRPAPAHVICSRTSRSSSSPSSTRTGGCAPRIRPAPGQLEQKRFDCILIGAGVRANPSNFLLFEKLINVVHEHAPQAKLCFNTMPSDTAAAVKRWL
jgi:hypothetical protein